METTALALLCALVASQPQRALAQPAATGEGVALPPVSVERPKQAPKRAQKKAQVKRAKVARPVSPPPAQAPATSAERGTGPVNGIVARQSVTGTKTDTPIIEIPQSISVVTRDQIVQQQAQSLPEAVRYIPGVSTELYGANSVSDEIRIRGFNAPRYLDGLRLPYDSILQFAQPRAEPYGLERIEILKGPSSGIYGQASPGGILNMVSKRPTAFHRNEVELQTGSFNRLQGAFDFSGPLDKDRQFLYRIVGLGRDADRVVDFNKEERVYIAPSLTWAPNADTSFTILSSLQYDKLNGQPQQYLPAYGTLFPNVNGRIPFSRNIGEPDYDRTTLNQQMIGYAFEHRFNDIFQFRQNLRYGNVDIEVFSMRNESGLSPTEAVTNRSVNYVAGKSRNFTVDNQLQADFSTGPLIHKLLLGLDYQQTDVLAEYRFSFGAYPLNVYNPVYGAVVIPGKDALTPFTHSNSAQDQLGVYVQDQIKFDRWILTLTGRFDRATADTKDDVSGVTVKQNDTAFTGRAGLNYLFDNGVAPYASYSTSFQPVGGFSLATAAGQPFKPTTGEGWEAGVKYQPPGLRALFTAAIFEITQQNVLTMDPNNPLFSIQTGEVRVRGIELEARASLTDRLDIIGGVGHIEPIVTKTTIAANVGNDLAVVPRDTAALWAMYTMRDGPWAGLGLGAGVRYVGSLYGDEANTLRIPSHTLFDAALSYEFGYLRPDLRGLRLQVNATNLFDKYYVANCFTGLPYCALGAPRTVLATLIYRWGEYPRPLVTKN